MVDSDTAATKQVANWNLGVGENNRNVVLSGKTDSSGAHTHSTTSSGAHTHTYSGTTGDATPSTDSKGSGSAHNNMPPYISVYMWKRTA